MYTPYIICGPSHWYSYIYQENLPFMRFDSVNCILMSGGFLQFMGHSSGNLTQSCLEQHVLVLSLAVINNHTVVMVSHRFWNLFLSALDLVCLCMSVHKPLLKHVSFRARPGMLVHVCAQGDSRIVASVCSACR